MTTTYDAFARYYDLQHGRFADDIPMYLRLARELAVGRSLLEIGCGTGRVMIPLLNAGYRVVGVDESKGMLQIASERIGVENIPSGREPSGAHTLSARGEWALIEADARGFALDERFGMVFIAHNTFLHNLTRDDQLNTLRAVHRHLLPGGPLIVDLPPNDELAYQPDDGAFHFEATLVDPVARSEISKSYASRIFWATQEQELSYRLEELRNGASHSETITFRLRHVFKHEMELLLLQSGFEPPTWFGDYDLNPYTEGSPRMIAVATPAVTTAANISVSSQQG
jgi:SAM-dependent methyltransferase